MTIMETWKHEMMSKHASLFTHGALSFHHRRNKPHSKTNANTTIKEIGPGPHRYGVVDVASRQGFHRLSTAGRQFCFMARHVPRGMARGHVLETIQVETNHGQPGVVLSISLPTNYHGVSCIACDLPPSMIPL